MHQSDGQPPRSDWRSWLVLGWAILVTVLYARMVVEQRGSKMPGWVHAARNR